MPGHAVQERVELADTLRSTEPAAPTLCGGWSVAQLAAHLVLRERSVVELLGRVPSGRAHAVAQRAIDAYVARTPYPRLIAAVAAGAPRWSPLALPPLREAVNLLEYLVHHEDVRRAAEGWVPRVLPVPRQDAVWSRLRVASRLTLRLMPVPVRLEWPDHGSISVGSGRPGVTVTGAPEELVLVAFGRQSVARVDYAGPDDAVARVQGADIAV
ncbi:MAG TPA: TIGR03085 family metal-binding protein [Jatrophihabitans sp.]